MGELLTSSLLPKSILIAEKNLAFGRILEELLQKKGFNPTVVSSGEEALEHIQKKHPDLAVLEVVMPKLLGTEVCEAVKQNERYSNLPVILMSSGMKEFSDIHISEEEFKADDYLLKPFAPELLLEKIKKLLFKPGTTADLTPLIVPLGEDPLRDSPFQAVGKSAASRPDPRAPLNIVVDVQSRDMFFSSPTMNISKGGFFVLTDHPLPIGQVIDLSFMLPDQYKTLRGQGRVVWTRKPGAGETPGMGIRFKDFAAEDLKFITDCIERLREVVRIH